MKSASSREQIDAVLGSDKIVLLDFWAPWCGPCMKMKGEVKRLAEAHADVEVLLIDVEDHPELAPDFHVTSLPTVLVYKNGTETSRSIGFQDLHGLEDLISK